MTVTIKKLTPPQITALRDAMPASVEAGVLTTTASTATFVEVADVIVERDGVRVNKYPKPLTSYWTTERVRKVVRFFAECYQSKPLAAVVAKLDGRPDLVVES